MAYVEFNNNPAARLVGDCAVRAISKALNMGWEAAYITLAINGMQMGDVMNANSVITATLRQHGFRGRTVPDTCPICYTAEDFCEDHPKGIFVLFFGNHVATVIDGTLYDAWNSLHEVVQMYWYKED